MHVKLCLSVPMEETIQIGVGNTGIVNTHNYIISAPHGCNAQTKILHQLRLIVNDDNIWKPSGTVSSTNTEKVRNMLKYTVMKNGFQHDWAVITPSGNENAQDGYSAPYPPALNP